MWFPPLEQFGPCPPMLTRPVSFILPHLEHFHLYEPVVPLLFHAWALLHPAVEGLLEVLVTCEVPHLPHVCLHWLALPEVLELPPDGLVLSVVAALSAASLDEEDEALDAPVVEPVLPVEDCVVPAAGLVTVTGVFTSSFFHLWKCPGVQLPREVVVAPIGLESTYQLPQYMHVCLYCFILEV